MRRITLWLLSTVAVVVLLFSYRTSTGGTAVATAAPTSISTPVTGSLPSTDSSPTASSSPTAATGSKTYTGSSASTRWGDVQVAITVSGGKIIAVTVPVYPNGNGRDQEINANALPILVQETLQKQSAAIDTVSGATVTSDGYLQSLQSALDAAHIS